MTSDLDRDSERDSERDLDWLRYERGELADDDARAVERALDTSPEGRARLALLRVLRAAAPPSGLPERLGDGASCPDEHTLARLAEGELEPDAAGAARAHLADCGHCLLLVEAALEEVAAAEAAVAARRAAELRSGWRVLANPKLRVAAAAAALAVIALLLFEQPSWESGELAGLAHLEALPVRIPRDAPTDAAESAYRAGLGHYASGDWAEAERELAGAHGLAPLRADVALYLGSTRLHAGRAAEAVAPLRAALRTAEDGWRREVLWQLAQAALLTNDGRWAREILYELEPGSGAHASEARELLVALDRLED